MSHGDTIPLHSSSQSDIDKNENLIYSNPSIVLPAHPPSPRAAIHVSSSPFMPPNLRPPPPPTSTTTNNYKSTPVPSIPSPPPLPSSGQSNIAATRFRSPHNTLTEPVWHTVKRDLSRIVSNLKLVVFPNPYREDPGKALRDWDLPRFLLLHLLCWLPVLSS